MSGKTVKVPGWQRQQQPPRRECAEMRQIVKEAVMSLYHESGQPVYTFACDLTQIYKRCQQKVRKRRADGTWNYPYRGKRTWDRRVNEAASEQNGAAIVAVTAGVYRPNVRLFKEV